MFAHPSNYRTQYHEMVFALLGLLVIALAGCTDIRKLAADSYVLTHRNYSLAVYNSGNKLITHPIRDLQHHLDHQLPQPITDVYVISHGWNMTVSEALSRYHSFTVVMDEQTKLIRQSNPAFTPFFILVVWPSATRPITSLASATMPYLIDESLRPVTTLIDITAFFLPTVWKQSLDASLNALGEKVPETYRLESSSSKKGDPTAYSVNEYDDDKSGRDRPVSGIIYRLLQINAEAPEKGRQPFKIHCVGHSFGGKLVYLASAEALRRWILDKTLGMNAIPEDIEMDSYVYDTALPAYQQLVGHNALPSHPIESLILINPAMRYVERLYYPGNQGSRIIGYFDPELLLEMVPRKAILYSNYDYPDGGFFDMSQLLLNNSITTLSHAKIKDLDDLVTRPFKDPDTGNPTPTGYVLSPVWLLYRLGTATAQIGVDIGTSALIWGIGKASSLPYNFFSHIRNHQFRYFSVPDYARYPLNILHFFLPVDELFGGSADQQGIFRSVLPALGRTGLNRGSTFGVSAGFTGTDIVPDMFCKLTQDIHTSFSHLVIKRGQFYSFDASKVYDRFIPPDGAHADFGEDKETSCEPTSPEKRYRTFNFVYNFSQTLQVR